MTCASAAALSSSRALSFFFTLPLLHTASSSPDLVRAFATPRRAQVTQLPVKPGRRNPPVETMLLLLIAHNAWRAFGRAMVTAELVFLYAPFLAVLTWATARRGRARHGSR